MKMTLAAALRYKKRIAEKINKAGNDARENNCIVKDGEREYDTRKSLERRAAWVRHMIDLKLAVEQATLPIKRSVLEVAELKSLITVYAGLNTQHGLVRSPYEEHSVTYEAQVRKGERDKTVTALQSQIDDLQTKIDAFNNATSVEFPDAPKVEE